MLSVIGHEWNRFLCIIGHLKECIKITWWWLLTGVTQLLLCSWEVQSSSDSWSFAWFFFLLSGSFVSDVPKFHNHVSWCGSFPIPYAKWIFFTLEIMLRIFFDNLLLSTFPVLISWTLFIKIYIYWGPTLCLVLF